ncbi:MAG: deoxyribonuclease IV [bacterium]|nr:deoxyribonuclease IV [bacterium]
MLLGAHISIAGGLHKAFSRGENVGCTAIQIFSKNANRWQAKALQEKDIQAFKTAWESSSIKSVIVHDSYLINLGTPKDELWQKSQNALLDELERCEQLGIPHLVMHPGSHVGSGEEEGLERVVQAFDRIHQQSEGYAVKILVETTAGQGTNLGNRFEHLARFFECVQQPERLGVCLDSCHVFAAGYELRTEAGYTETFEAFDKLIGLDRLKAIHMNDSLKPLGCRVDRHQGIGEGEIGLEGFRFLMNDPRLRGIPMILETPKGDDPVAADRENLNILRNLIIP